MLVVELEALQPAHRAVQDSERILASLVPKPATYRPGGAPLIPKPWSRATARPIRAAASSNVGLLPELEAKKVSIPRDARTRGAELVARAIGDSMEGPNGFRDRQLVFFKPTKSRRMATGKIVVCRLDDAT